MSQVFLQKRQLDVILQSDFHDFINFSAKCQLLLVLLPTTSATSPSNVGQNVADVADVVGVYRGTYYLLSISAQKHRLCTH